MIKTKIRLATPVLPIVEFILERIDATLLLTTENRVWDADIISRTVLETLMKLMFISYAEGEEKDIRLNEFWNSLSEINSIKQSEQAKKNLAHLGGNKEIHHLAYSKIILPIELEKELKDKWPRSKRKIVEQKWSFSEIVSSLSKNFGGVPLPIFETLPHTYRMSSHIAHGDETGILIIRERNSRSSEDQYVANRAHYLRLLSDCLSYSNGTSISTMKFLNTSSSKFKDILLQAQNLQPLIEKYHAAVFNDPDYDSYRAGG